MTGPASAGDQPLVLSASRWYVFTVAQIFNLPYRRFVIGGASDRSQAPSFPNVWQSATLRYRLQVCATVVDNTVNRYRQASCLPKSRASCPADFREGLDVN